MTRSIKLFSYDAGKRTVSLTEEEMPVNSQIDMEQYPEMFYGRYISSSVIHFIFSLEFLGMVVNVWLMFLEFPTVGVTTYNPRQCISNWMAVPVKPNLPRLTLLRYTSTQCLKAGDAHDRLHTLSRLPAHRRRNQLSCQSPLLVRQHQRDPLTLGL